MWRTDDGPFWAARFMLSWSEVPIPADVERWEESVRALRSVSSRVEKFRGRKPGIDPKRADEVMDQYFQYLHPVRLKGNQPARSLQRLRVLPDQPHEHSFLADTTYFFALLFGSLLRPFADPVCGRCGRELPPSAKHGKISRAAYCARCRERIRWEGLSAKERREITREKQRKYRAKHKGVRHVK